MPICQEVPLYLLLTSAESESLYTSFPTESPVCAVIAGRLQPQVLGIDREGFAASQPNDAAAREHICGILVPVPAKRV